MKCLYYTKIFSSENVVVNQPVFEEKNDIHFPGTTKIMSISETFCRKTSNTVIFAISNRKDYCTNVHVLYQKVYAWQSLRLKWLKHPSSDVLKGLTTMKAWENKEDVAATNKRKTPNEYSSIKQHDVTARSKNKHSKRSTLVTRARHNGYHEWKYQ